ncbi:TPA: hypothetical protein TZ315_001490 [Streptococcus suis]|nr:hypothetical protein [Streptococcus suis]HEL1996869.1 hypothetical protein [Streptococcus suis]HEL2553562.1 hypothetical protein [Streptococcus suis]HEM3669970.1 hypothetical protein [Streptococcus suis]HEM3686114.1 hypothetical protein [Streptococcus suis]
MWDRQIDSLEVSYATLVTAREEGREEGREELQITSARNFLLAGVDIDIISNSLNLPLERVLQLQNELNANT